MNETEFLTTQEVAQQLGVNDSRVRQLRLKGRIAGIKRGATWFFKRSDVEAFKQAREAKQKKKQAPA